MGFKEGSGYLDAVEWHAAGDYPEGFSRSAATTHMGIFLAWAIRNQLASKRHYDKTMPAVGQLAVRALTPGAYFREVCEEWLTAEDFNDRGHAFAEAMYDEYLTEYGCMFLDLGSYRAPDTWDTYELVAEMLDALLAEWEEGAEPGAAPDRPGV